MEIFHLKMSMFVNNIKTLLSVYLHVTSAASPGLYPLNISRRFVMVNYDQRWKKTRSAVAIIEFQ